MDTRSTNAKRLKFSLATSAAWAVLLTASASSLAQTRVTGLDVSWYQGVLSQANWNTIHNVDGRDFAFIRSSRGGTTGNYYPSNTANDTLAQFAIDSATALSAWPITRCGDRYKAAP